MDSKTKKQLEEAKVYFYAWKLTEAYNLLRRFFDRLPFRPEAEHAEYVGIFARVLVELGKEYELKFYLQELERLYEKSRDPPIAYPLGVIYTYLPEPQMEAARQVFENIVKNSDAVGYHAKAKMMLAMIYDVRGDVLAARMIIDSISRDPDPTVNVLVEIWKAHVCRREKKFTESLSRLDAILKTLSSDANWYAYFSAKLILGMVYIDQQNLESAREVVTELRNLFAGRTFKSVQSQLGYLEDLIGETKSMGVLKWVLGDTHNTCKYENRSVPLKTKSTCGRLMQLLVKKRYVPKEFIVKDLYSRQYTGEEDDKLIYYHIHSLRKRLRALGLPAEVILFEANGYRLMPEVEIVGAEL